MPHLHVFLNYVMNEFKLAKVEFVASAVAEHHRFGGLLKTMALSRLDSTSNTTSYKISIKYEK